MDLRREKLVITASSVGIILNIILFLSKIYISLSINSIAIFSDGVNNLVDSISCILTVICMYVSVKNQRNGSKYINSKLEQTLSLILSIAVLFVGGYFLYSSLERLVYPTPVWFSTVYFWVIFATVVVKLLMSAFYHHFYKLTHSPALKVMRTDSLTDSAVTFVTLLSFLLVAKTDFTIDAFAGIGISVFIIIEAILLVKSSLFSIVNYVPKKKREEVESSLANLGEVKYINYLTNEETTVCFAELSGVVEAEEIEKITQSTGVEIYLLNR